MEYRLLGWPEDGTQLRLDHREFSYAGKFVMSNTGKAVAEDAGEIVAAVAFSADRTDDDVAWLRYVTVRAERRAEGVGPRLAAYATARLRERGYERVRIAVNNPFAYHALHKAGFGFTGERTGLAELVLAHPGDRSRYGEGLALYRERSDLSDAEREFLNENVETGPPPTLDPPGERPDGAG